MKNTQLSHTVFVLSLLVAPVLYAQEYPASSFQPKVIYSSDATAVQAASQPCAPKAAQTEVDPKYPAASFQPKVIYNSADAK